MLGLGPDRKVLGIHFQRRLFLAGAHPARPRYPRRLRAVEIGDRKIVGARAAGAPRHGDDGLTRPLRNPTRCPYSPSRRSGWGPGLSDPGIPLAGDSLSRRRGGVLARGGAAAPRGAKASW